MGLRLLIMKARTELELKQAKEKLKEDINSYIAEIGKKIKI